MPSTTAAPRPADAPAACEWCERHPDRPCPACNARRRRAVRLVERRGFPIADAARQMGLPVGRVERLLEEEADRRSLAEFRQTHVENAPLRRRFRQRQLIDPALTVSALARSVGTSPIQVERWLGLRPTAQRPIGTGARSRDARSMPSASRTPAGWHARWATRRVRSKAADPRASRASERATCRPNRRVPDMTEPAHGTKCW